MWVSYLYLVGVVAGIPLAIVAILVASYFVRARFWLSVQAVAATLQGYTISVAGIFPSISLLAGLGAWRSLFTSKEIFRTPWLRWLVALLIFQLIAMVWSPEPVAAIRHVVFAFPMLTMCAAMYGFTKERFDSAARIMTWALRVAVVIPILVIICRLFPVAEGYLYGARLTQFFVSPNILSTLFIDGGNNVIAADKAGGLFINANTASVYLGVCAFLAWGLSKVTRQLSMRLLAFLFWAAVFFTGSKAGAIAAVVMPFLAWLLRFIRLRRVSLLPLIAVCVAGCVVVVMLPLVVNIYASSGFTDASLSTLQSREVIWEFARGMLRQHFLLGLGHGGWEEQFAFSSYASGFRGVMPAHNAFLIIWSQAGAPAAIAGFGFVVALAWWCIRNLWHADSRASALCGGLLWAFVWYVFQSQGENFGLVGQFHLTPLLGMAMGMTLAVVGLGPGAEVTTRRSHGAGQAAQHRQRASSLVVDSPEPLRPPVSL